MVIWGGVFAFGGVQSCVSWLEAWDLVKRGICERVGQLGQTKRKKVNKSDYPWVGGP